MQIHPYHHTLQNCLQFKDTAFHDHDWLSYFVFFQQPKMKAQKPGAPSVPGQTGRKTSDAHHKHKHRHLWQKHHSLLFAVIIIPRQKCHSMVMIPTLTLMPAFRSSSNVGLTLSWRRSSTPVRHSSSMSRSSDSTTLWTRALRSCRLSLAWW